MNPEHQGLSAEEIALLEESDANGNPLPQPGEPGHADYVAPDDDAVAKDPAKALGTVKDGEEDGPTDDLIDPQAKIPPAGADQAAEAAAQAAAAAEAAATATEPPPIPDLPPTPQLLTVDVDRATAQAAIDAALERQAQAMQAFADGGEVGDFNKINREATLEIGRMQGKLSLHDTNDSLAAAHEARVSGYQDAVLQNITVTAKAAGVDYTDPSVGTQFDMAFRMLAADKAHAGKDFRALADMAHTAVCAIRGVAASPPPAAAQASPPKFNARSVDKAAIPPTLSRVPVALDVDTGRSDEFAHLDGLSGDDLERKIAAMTADQLERFLP